MRRELIETMKEQDKAAQDAQAPETPRYAESLFEHRDVLTPEEAKSIDRETSRRARILKEKRKPRRGHITRRAVFQTHSALQKALSHLWDFRIEARDRGHLDEVQYLTEAIFHAKRVEAYLSLLSGREFSRDPEDLEVYK